MKSIILLLCLISFAPLSANAQLFYRHKSEAKIAAMTPAERVDEWVKEQRHHRYNLSDDQWILIRKYIMLDGAKAVLRLVEYLEQYNPLPQRRDKAKQAVNFESCSMMLDWIDNFAVRLRSSEEGRRAINALERSTEQMRAAGFAVKEDGYDYNHGAFEAAVNNLKEAKGVNDRDENIQNTFRIVYKIIVSDAELIEFSNYLTKNHPEYPSWSERQGVTDKAEIAPDDGSPRKNAIKLKKPERYYRAYLEFKESK